MGFANLMIARMGAPVTPNGPTAQSWLLRELANPAYRASQPTWFDRVSTAVLDWLNSLVPKSVAGAPNLGPLVVVIIVVVVVVIAFLVFGVPRLNRRSRVVGELFGEDDRRTAAEILAAARSAASANDFSLAVLEGLRSIARSLGERTLLTMFPGTTAHDFAARASELFPDYRKQLELTARSFDGVRYLDARGTPEQWLEIERLAIELQTARPTNQLLDA
jgi:hypothetical protein